MRILHLITRMDRGGSAVNTLLSAMGQLRSGHSVELAVGPSIESDMSQAELEKTAHELDAFRHSGGIVHTLPSLFRRLHPASDVQALGQIQQVLAPGFDVVHTHTSKAGALGRLAAWGRTRAVVHTPHGHVFHGYFGSLGTRFFVRAEQLLAHRCHALVALTGQERDDHLALGVGRAEQWYVIPSGVDVDAIARQTTRAHGEPEWEAVSVGRLVPVKGMDRLIRAWHEVVRRKPEARLAIVGDGVEAAKLKALVRELGLEHRVHFAGWADPLPYLRSARCFVLLSHNEGMGRAVVEAMAAGLPCIVSDVCGLRELVDAEVGMRVEADNPGQVADMLLRDWPAALSGAARRRAQDYSVEAMVEGLLRLYGELLHVA